MIGCVRSADPSVEIAAKPTWLVRGSRTKSALATAFISAPPLGSLGAVVIAPFFVWLSYQPVYCVCQRSPYLYVRKRVLSSAACGGQRQQQQHKASRKA